MSNSPIFPSVEERIVAFAKLGEHMQRMSYVAESYNDYTSNEETHSVFKDVLSQCKTRNPWFTSDNIAYSLRSWAEVLTSENLNIWIQPYDFEKKRNQDLKIAVIMAGNIPMVGMHDFLCTLISGNRLLAKLSKDDKVLLPYLAKVLCEFEPGFTNFIEFTEEKIENFDAVIATGSNNTARYFEYYFSKYPHIIRKNRNGVAVLTGNESESELNGIASDICRYFGLGCRSISKVFIPNGYDPIKLLQACSPFEEQLFSHFKYMNNYNYQKTIFLMNLELFFDSGTILLKESNAYSSPIAVINFEFYSDPEVLKTQLNAEMNLIQAIVSIDIALPGAIQPGNVQNPQLWDYSDGIDTLEFLLSL